MQWIRNYDTFVDFISYVLLSAPDDFPREDYLSDDEQMTLEKAFDELHDGMQFVEQKVRDEGLVKQLRSILDSSRAAYRQGDDVKGAHLLQDFEAKLLKKGGRSHL